MPTAELGKVRIHYELSGAQSADVIVLSHSLGANLHMWDKIVPALERHFRVLRYDSRGHGESGVPPAPYTLSELGGDLLELLTLLDIETPHLCGLSLGGLVGMWIGINEPDRIKRLILANTAARIGTREMWKERIAGVRKAGMGPLSQTMLERWFTEGFRQLRPGEMETIREMIAATSSEGYVGCCAAIGAADLRGMIETIAARTLVITGSQDPATTPDDGRWLHAALENSVYVELQSSHLSAWERPEEFQRAVIDFLS
jgi:3-oxoadipate enol-lactonase